MQTSLPAPESSTADQGLFDRRPRLLAISLVVLFLMAGAIRFYRLQAPGLLIDRDYMSAIYARSFYFAHTDSVEPWRKVVALATSKNQPVREPPVTEFLVSLLYRAAGGERIWLARLLTSSFWLIGGVFVYRIAQRVATTDAAVFAATYYLFVPLGITLSRSFQPDALMMLTFLVSLLSIVRYYERPTVGRLLIATALSSLTVLHRPLVLFPLLGAFTAMTLSEGFDWKRVIDGRLPAFAAISLVPAVLYYGYGVLGAGVLRPQVQMSFRPYLLSEREYWMGWLYLANHAVGSWPIIGAVIGLPMLRKGLPRALLAGLGAGYVAFGLVFTQHIHTHDYYQAMLIPIVAIALGPLVVLVAGRLRQAPGRWTKRLVVAGALGLALAFSFLEVRAQVGSQVFESAETAREIGGIVNHSNRVVYLARYYGQPLQYNGELTGAYWPRSITYYLNRRDEPELSIQQRLDALGFVPEYFVITDFSEYTKNHGDLQEYLTEYCALVADNARYLIYKDCTRL